MFILPLQNRIKVPTLMERIEVRRCPALFALILEHQHRRHISRTHQRQTQRLDTVVDVHSIADFEFMREAEVEKVLIGLELVNVFQEVVFPCILSDEVEAV